MRLISSFLVTASLAMAAEGSGWRKDPQHPQLEYRISCQGGSSLTILWRNGYQGAVSFKFRAKSDSRDGIDDAKIAPGETFLSDLDTMYCSLSSLRVSVVKFSMAAPPPPPPPPPAAAKPAEPAKKELAAPEVVLSGPLFDPKAEKLPEIGPEKLAAVSKGMTKEDVVAKLGLPASKLSVRNDGEYLESYQYRLGSDKIGVVHFTNGTVTDIVQPNE